VVSSRAVSRLGVLSIVLAVAGVACDDAGGSRAYDTARPTVALHGVGATVSRALFAKWAAEYAMVDPSTTVTYDPAGSGAGVRAALDATADFGVSDSPLAPADALAHPEVWHLPVAVEAIAIVYSLPALGSARLEVSEDVLAGMLLGNVSWWDDASLAALNPGVKLPHTAVRPAFRGDQSGSSYLLSEWLSKTSPRWPFKATRALTLPGGVSAQKDDGMIERVRSSEGSIGYVSAVTAMEQHLASFAVRNAAGRYVSPSLEGMRAAASSVDLGGDLRADAVGSPADLAYPVCSFTFVLVRADGTNVPARRALARFLWWATHDGQSFAPPLGFGAVPGEVGLRDDGVVRGLKAGGEAAL
jgi:phosphate transport system substrate-binding protein